MSYQHHLVNVDHDTKQLLRTVEQRLLPTLEKVSQFQKSDNARPLTASEKEPISNLFVTTSSQLDALWQHLRPEFDVQLIVPIDVPPPFAPPATLVLSRVSAIDERDHNVLPKESMREVEAYLLNDEERDSLQLLQDRHRQSLQEATRTLAASYSKESEFSKQIKRGKDQRLRELAAARADIDLARDLARKSHQKL